MTSKQKSCSVAFPIERNYATSDPQGATAPATYPQPISLKALASKVLERNQERNLPATRSENDRNFYTGNQQLSAIVATAATEEKKETVDYSHQPEASLLPGSPAVCQNCNWLEFVKIMGANIPGCLYQITEGEWTEGWKRLPIDLKKCLRRLIFNGSQATVIKSSE